MSFWCNIKRGKCWVDIYYQGQKIATVKVDEKNVGNRACISLDSDPDVKFKVVKLYSDPDNSNNIEDESKFNKEEFNR